MSYSKKQREWYNHDRQLVCEALGITKTQYNWFRLKGQALHSIYEDQCNGFESEEQEKYADNLETKLNAMVEAKAKELGLFVFFQTDPRGATIYLDTKEIPYNNYNKAHCIY